MDGNNNVSTTTLHFFYDAQSRPAFVEYNGAKYGYIYNLQGDVVALVDAAGELVVKYKYDACGKQFYQSGSMADSLGTLNPFRYRAYVYDTETGLYYLRSRYYSPGIIRFINADTVLLSKNIWGGNVYSYCYNIPIGFVDKNGMTPEVYPRPSRPLDWDKDYLSDPRNQLYAIDSPLNKKPSFFSRVGTFLKSIWGTATYVESNNSLRSRSVLGGFVGGYNTSTQTSGNTGIITHYRKVINGDMNLGVSIGCFSIEVGESGLTFAGSTDTGSIYINCSDQIYFGKSTVCKTKGKTSYSDYEEIYVDPLQLAFVLVGTYMGIGSIDTYSVGLVF